MAQINIMAMRHSAFYAPLLMTIQGGFLEKQGLQPNYKLQTPDNLIVDNLQSGGAHLSQSAPAANFAALEKGEDLGIMHFAAINQRDGFYLAARESRGKFSWSDLEGEQVLVDHLFQPLATLRYAMHLNGADFDKMDVIDAGNVEQMDQAFRSGQGAYVHQQGPAPQQLEADGLGTLVASIGDAIGPIAFSSLCATPAWLDSDMAQAFVAAYREGMAATVERSPGEIADTIGTLLPGIDHDVLVKTIADYKQLNTWRKAIEITQESYANLLRVFRHSDLISKDHPMDSCVVNPPV
jgi:NitT/TauT family transport system substrate-binding protein